MLLIVRLPLQRGSTASTKGRSSCLHGQGEAVVRSCSSPSGRTRGGAHACAHADNEEEILLLVSCTGKEMPASGDAAGHLDNSPSMHYAGDGRGIRERWMPWCQQQQVRGGAGGCRIRPARNAHFHQSGTHGPLW